VLKVDVINIIYYKNLFFLTQYLQITYAQNSAIIGQLKHFIYQINFQSLQLKQRTFLQAEKSCH